MIMLDFTDSTPLPADTTSGRSSDPQTVMRAPLCDLDLFSGIGGFTIGLENAGMQTVAFCEINPWCQGVLKKHWPHIPIYEDVRTLGKKRLAADGITKLDIIAGGFPCQDQHAQAESQRS